MDILQASKQSRVSIAYYLLRKKNGFFLETPQQLRLTCYHVNNFLATLSLKLILTILFLNNINILFLSELYQQFGGIFNEISS